MSDHSHGEHFSVKKYVMVFVALLVGTIVTVAANYMNLSSVVITVAIALIIASIKAFLVAGYFMHLTSERKMIYAILAATAFFFVGLMFLTIWAMSDFPDKTTFVH